jgi:DNA-binding MarR family transcriptional regulator
MSDGAAPGWTFLSNHGHVLVCIAGDADLRLRDIASRVGITERAVFSIVNDLEADGYLTRIHVGRRNRYGVLTSAAASSPEPAPTDSAVEGHEHVGT